MGLIPQGRQHRTGGREQMVLAGGRGELGQARAEDEAPLRVARDQPVVLQGDGDAMGRRPGQVRGGDELGEGRRARLQGAHDEGRLVDDAHTAAGR